MFPSCRPDPPLFSITNLSSNQIFCFGHAGMGEAFQYPANTYESIEPCLRIGADGTEIDVQLSADSALVLYHDHDLSTKTDATGKIADHDWAAMEDTRYASPISTDVYLRRLDDILDRFADGHRIFTLDCKLLPAAGEDYGQYRLRFAHAIVRLAQDRRMANQLFVESDDADFLTLLHQSEPTLRLFIYRQDFGAALATADAQDLYGITINARYITSAQVDSAHAHSRRVTLFGAVTEDENIAAIAKSPDHIQSDKIIHLLKVFGKYR